MLPDEHSRFLLFSSSSTLFLILPKFSVFFFLFCSPINDGGLAAKKSDRTHIKLQIAIANNKKNTEQWQQAEQSEAK